MEGGRNRKFQKIIGRILEDSPEFSKDLVGFSLYDPSIERSVYGLNESKYFTPASNAKVFTLYYYLSLRTDSIPSYLTVASGSSLLLYPLGDPTLLHPGFSDQGAFQKIKDHPADTVLLVIPEFHIPKYGPGWAWDDFDLPFQAERTALPLFGNVVTVSRSNSGDSVCSPPFFGDLVEMGDSGFLRNPHFNYFQLPKFFDSQKEITIPYLTGLELTTRLLSDTLKKVVRIWGEETGIAIPGEWKKVDPQDSENVQTSLEGNEEDSSGGIKAFGQDVTATKFLVDTVYSLPTRQVLRRMMLDSDNFLAEQLLLNAFLIKGSSSDVSSSMRSMVADIEQGLEESIPSDPLVLVDGSGLSRYNLFTPRSMVATLRLLYMDYEWEFLSTIFSRRRNFRHPERLVHRFRRDSLCLRQDRYAQQQPLSKRIPPNNIGQDPRVQPHG